MKTHIELNRSDILKIQEVLKKFPEVTSFELRKEDGGGIGYCLDMTLPSNVNDILGKFTIPIVVVDSW